MHVKTTPSILSLLLGLSLLAGCASAPSLSQLKSSLTPIAPVARGDANSIKAHEQLLQKAKQGRIDVYFMGDSITRRWGATDYPQFLAHWNENFHGWNAGNFGWGADSVEHMLWRIENGELEGVNPKVIVLLGGTNNVGDGSGGDQTVEHVVRGIQTLLVRSHEMAPDATIVLMAIFPRNDNPGANALINRINQRISKFADGKQVRFLNLNDQLASPDGTLREGMAVDNLHLGLPGYTVWAEALKPIFTEVLGPPAAEDKAPPPTGDPSAQR